METARVIGVGMAPTCTLVTDTLIVVRFFPPAESTTTVVAEISPSAVPLYLTADNCDRVAYVGHARARPICISATDCARFLMSDVFTDLPRVVVLMPMANTTPAKITSAIITSISVNPSRAGGV